MLRFYKEDAPPVLNNGVNDIQVENYTVGAPNDPHWKLYPKNQFLTARNMFPIGYAFTDYSADANHYVYYMPDNDGPTWTYSRLLRDHFETLHKYRQQANREQREIMEEQQRILKEENKQKVKQIKGLIEEQKKLLKQYTNEMNKLKANRDRAIRTAVRSGMSKEQAEFNFDSTNQMYQMTGASIVTIQTNITSLKNELKNYTD